MTVGRPNVASAWSLCPCLSLPINLHQSTVHVAIVRANYRLVSILRQSVLLLVATNGGIPYDHQDHRLGHCPFRTGGRRS